MTTRKEWLRRVASAAATNLGASETGEILGLNRDEVDALSNAEFARLEWAEDVVRRRLYRMGGRS